MVGATGDTGTTLAKTFLAAAKKLKDLDLRKALTARVYAAVPTDAADMP